MNIEAGTNTFPQTGRVGGEFTFPTPGTETAPTGPGFGDVLETAFTDANRMQKVAGAAAEALARGASDDLHGTMITSKEAEISLKLVGSVRNKLLDAFHELWRINL